MKHFGHKLRSFLTKAGFLCALLAPALSHADSATDSLATVVAELRAAGHYREALAVAESLRAYVLGNTERLPWELHETSLLVSTLERALALAPANQLKLAYTDALDDSLLDAYYERQYDRGFEIAERQLAVRREFLGNEHPDVSWTMNMIGSLHWDRGDFVRAEPHFREALAIDRASLGAHPEVATSLNNLALLLQDAGRNDESLAAFSEACSLYEALLGPSNEKLATCLQNIGGVLRAKGDFVGADRHYRNALSMRTGSFGPDHPQVAISLEKLAGLMRARGRLGEAESMMRRALAIRTDEYGDGDRRVATTLHDLALILNSQGKYVSAEPLFRRAIAEYRASVGPEHPDVAACLINLARLLTLQGNHAAAMAAAEEAVSIFSERYGEEHRTIAGGLHLLARNQEGLGNRAAADSLDDRAIAMRERVLGREHPSFVIALNQRAERRSARGFTTDAVEICRKTLALLTEHRGPSHPRVAAGQARLARALRHAGQPAEAESLYRCAAAIEAKALGEAHGQLAGTLHELGALLLLEDRAYEANEVLAHAARVFDAARLRAGADLERATFRASPYADLAIARLAVGDKQGAWQAAELSRARVFLEHLDQSDATGERALENSLRARLTQLESRRAAFARSDFVEHEDSASALAVEAARVEAELSRAFRDRAILQSLEENEQVSIEAIAGALLPDQAVVGWVEGSAHGPGSRLAYVIRSTGELQWAFLSHHSPPRSIFSPGALRDSIAGAGLTPFGADDLESTRRDSRELYDQYITPLLPWLGGVTRLIAVPSGDLAGIPLEVARAPDGRLLVDAVSVTYAPSASAWAKLAGRARTEQPMEGRALLVGDPTFHEPQLATTTPGAHEPAPAQLALLRSAMAGDRTALASLPGLPAARDEVNAIAAIHRTATALVGTDASEVALFDMARSGELAHFSLLHFATHALVDHDVPSRSALILSQVGLPDPLEAALNRDRVYDGVVTADEIATEWELRADLVTLSACESALGRHVSGEGHIGLARALFRAGTRSVLVSLWKVEDRATQLLMQKFYRNLNGRDSNRMGTDQALRDAKVWLRTYTDATGAAPYAHPFFWAPFVLIGSP